MYLYIASCMYLHIDSSVLVYHHTYCGLVSGTSML
jgi:hypothetical protein